MRVLQTDKADKQPDADGDGEFQILRDGVEDGLTHIQEGKQDEEDALGKYRSQSNLPGIVIGLNHRIGKISVEPHAGGKSKGEICKQRHTE